ncbi:uncharacterized protein LOC131853768 [Achroia grisella]|uniref:uncharacterized protein LOC131853768 n=1 Tax=Achroia grisella TaxID=688607 RepID=UPI0027D2B95D|nr:uncharacterized protein LOC131853768 [Achroia grisella]
MSEGYRISAATVDNKSGVNHDENYCLVNVICVFISLVTILADLTTDILVFAEYCHNSRYNWATATFLFIVTPNVIINIFSIRWYVCDQKINVRHWITHGFLIGLLERYVTFLYKVFACKNLESIKTEKWVSKRNDLSLLHFLYVFTGTIPQIILQSYAIIVLSENYYTKAFALTASIASVIWSCSTYIYSTTVFTHEGFQWSSFIIKLTWHFAILIGRIPSILVFAMIFGIWTLIPLGLHWSVMTFWIVMQKTSFCANKLEEALYNVVMGFLYCFCYINLSEGETRYRLLLFYTLIVTQNFGGLLLYVLISDIDQQKKPWSIAATVCVIAGTLIGIATMILYYKYFHIKRLKEERNNSHCDIELNNKVTNEKSDSTKTVNHVRAFKSGQITELPRKKRYKKKNVASPEPTSKSENQNVDKNFLLDHWIAMSRTPTLTSVPLDNSSMDVSSIEVYTVENTPRSNTSAAIREDSELYRTHRQIECLKSLHSPNDLILKLSSIKNIESSIDEITSNNMNIQKRRGICSSDELRDSLTNINEGNDSFIKNMKIGRSSEISQDTDGSNKKTSSDSIDMDLDLSFSDINSSDINTFNENIVQKLCLSALKNIKVGNQDADIENIQRIALDILKEMYTKKDKSRSKVNKERFLSKQRDLDTPSELLSVHDYENICAVNIAREAWGLRSWNGYSDIENCQHDGSVVRDRRGDTFTSESSEISSCLSQELKNAMMSAPPFSKKTPTYSNISVNLDRDNQDYVNTAMCVADEDTVITKPCVIDFSKDPYHLEPIIEELDDLGDIDTPAKKRLNSESSLVATIDEIRNAFINNSPRNLYHRREHLWDSPHYGASASIENTLKKALWKEPSKFDSSNIMESLPEKENIISVSHDSKFHSNNESRILDKATQNDFINVESAETSRNPRRRQKTNICGIKLQNKKLNNKSDHRLQDLSNRDIDFLWQLVSENSLPHSSIEDLSSTRISSSLQSLIQKDPGVAVVSTPAPKITNIKKGVRSKPRRKFSILREKFEPKINLNSDKEILCHGLENKSSALESNFINVINDLDATKDRINFNSKTNSSSTHTSDYLCSKSIKEKRSLFMKQVLSPPKFNTKLKHKM